MLCRCYCLRFPAHTLSKWDIWEMGNVGFAEAEEEGDSNGFALILLSFSYLLFFTMRLICAFKLETVASELRVLCYLRSKSRIRESENVCGDGLLCIVSSVCPSP